jgi:hypothetical protein
VTSNPHFTFFTVAALISGLWIAISLRLGKTIGYSTNDLKPFSSRRDNPWAYWCTLAVMGTVFVVSLWKIAAGLISS